MLQHHRAALAGAGAVLALSLLTGCNGSTDSSASTSSSSTSATDSSTDTGTAQPTGSEATGAESSSTSTGTETASTSSTSSSTSTSTSAAGGAVVSRDHTIRLTLPAGWENNSAAVGTEATLSARSTEPLSGFAPVMLVTSGNAPSGSLPALVANTGRKKAAQVGGQFATTPARTIGGVSSPGYQVTATQEGKQLVHREYYLVRKGTLYVVTLSCAADQVKAADAQFDALLKGWAWA